MTTDEEVAELPEISGPDGDVDPGEIRALARPGDFIVKKRTVSEIQKLGQQGSKIGATNLARGQVLMASDALQHALGLTKERLESVSQGDHEGFKNIADATCDLANSLIRGAEVILRSEESKAEPTKPYIPVE